MKELRSSSLQSLSDSPGIRSTVWKVLLGYLTPERSLWSTELKQKRSQYKHYKDELLTTSELNNTPLRAKRSQESIVYVGNPDPQAIKVLNMIKLHGKPIRVNKASQDKKIIDVGCLWKQLKQWLIFTLLPKAAH
ncbi:hypothetical protein YC2023_099050 [Brassica napus]